VTAVFSAPGSPVDHADLSDLAFWAGPPHLRFEAFARLRSERPIAFFDEPSFGDDSELVLPEGHGYWAVTRHADVTEVTRNPGLFCSGKGALSIVDLPQELVDYFTGMVSTDNPRHARLRDIVSGAFTPRRVRAIGTTIQLVADRLIDRVADLGECDFATSLAAPLSIEIICDMMGVPPSQYATVLRCSNEIIYPDDVEFLPEGSDHFVAMLHAGQELTALMADVADHRRRHPADDLTTALITTNIDGEALTQPELASFFILLLTAGNETSRNALTYGLHLLSEHPDQRDLWQADPDGVGATGVDEIVRWATPVNWTRRTVTEDTVLAGQELHVDDKVVLVYGSANQDETVFDDPAAFDVLRRPNPHVSFGAAGPHFCLGAHLARREIDMMLRRLFTRLPDIEAAGEPEWGVSRLVSGIKHLPCRFTPV
jgi:cytochrome P450